MVASAGFRILKLVPKAGLEPARSCPQSDRPLAFLKVYRENLAVCTAESYTYLVCGLLVG